jgi:predicted dehydrogenase
LHQHLELQLIVFKIKSKEKFMATHRLGIIMHGVTGRMGMNQHLIRSIVAIRNQGGVTLSNGNKVMPDPILIGRNAEKIEALAKANGISRFGTDLDKALANKDDTVFFDAGTTQMRPTLLAKAIHAGKHVYCEKPIATNLNEAVEIARLAEKSGVKHGAVQDKLFLPGLRKLDMLRKAGFFGKMLSVRIEFGYWVFEGDLQPIQRPSWNYRKEDGGGIILDMVCHWRYVLDNLFGEVQSVSCLGATHIPTRWDEANKPYECTADDAAYATFELKGHQGEHVVAQVNSSWTTRVNREDLVTFHVDGTHGSAVAGLQACKAQSRVNTPRPVWNPDVKQTMTFTDQWQEVPDTQFYDNGFKIQWEHFIRHIVENEPYRWTLPEGAKGVQLVEAALQSWQERRWVDVAPLKI